MRLPCISTDDVEPNSNSSEVDEIGAVSKDIMFGHHLFWVIVDNLQDALK